MIRQFQLIIATTMWLGMGISWASAQTPQPAIDEIFRDYDRSDSPGCALGVMKRGDLVYGRAYGLANLEYEIPLTTRSVFRIGSTSKQFTATAIALLEEAGALSLDDPLKRYFSEFPAWADGITLRHLVHHTSGIRDYLELAHLAGKSDESDHYTDEWVLQLLARQQATNFAPGTEYLYSDSGYLLLAHVVMHVSGMSLGEYAAKNIFGPLGMHHTHFHDDHTLVVRNRASGHAPVGDSSFRLSMTTLEMVGDGGVFTSIEDLIRWDRNFQQNRLGKRSADLITLLTTPGRLDDGVPINYAFGLQVEDFGGVPMLSHSGAIVGFQAELLRFPDQRIAVAVLCNRADAPADSLARQVAGEVLRDVLHQDAHRPGAGQPAPGARPELSADQLAEYVGDYWEESLGFAAETRLDEGRLWAVHSPTSRNQLVPAGPDHFRMIGLPAEVYVHFDRDETGIVAVRRTINGKPRGQFRRFTRRHVTPPELAEYVGTYYSPELDVAYQLSIIGERLMFSIPDGSEGELTPMFAETFEHPQHGSFTFERDSDTHSISGFHLQHRHIRNLRFYRSSLAAPGGHPAADQLR